MKSKMQREIANDLITGLRRHVNHEIRRIPDNWDGIEIRQWITDLAAEQIAHGHMSHGRKLCYENTRIVDNL